MSAITPTDTGTGRATGRIHWERNDDGATVTAAWEGSAGKIDEASFWIFEPTDSEPWWILTSTLPGQGRYRVHNDEAEALKRHAERWLAEFVSSLGAIFPAEVEVDPFGPEAWLDHHPDCVCPDCAAARETAGTETGH
jgi:hypothetical protein